MTATSTIKTNTTDTLRITLFNRRKRLIHSPTGIKMLKRLTYSPTGIKMLNLFNRRKRLKHSFTSIKMLKTFDTFTYRYQNVETNI